MTNVWQRFQDPVWQQAAKNRPQGSLGSVWHITKTDSKEQRQHKLRVKDWLFTNNLTEELLLNHPSPDDVKLLKELRISYLYDYFTPSDVAKIGCIENRVVLNKRSLTITDRTKLEQAVIRAERLYKRHVKRLGKYSTKQQWQHYKQQIQGI